MVEGKINSSIGSQWKYRIDIVDESSAWNTIRSSGIECKSQAQHRSVHQNLLKLEYIKVIK
ncbi:polymorphic toxin type 15 domain-containing protein [Bacillus haynesii]|uniref:polymorphic toxin type 15 domain-containing protein n=1 Tax=Bacillus haynesii TaxID=1925021 RepID=UPI0035DEDEFC